MIGYELMSIESPPYRECNMTQKNLIQEIVNALSGLKVTEKRKSTDSYFEVVFSARDVAQWQATLTQHLGPPIKPASAAATDVHMAITRAHGGIMAGQTLFYGERDNVRAIAMFWPWSDGKQITLKLAILPPK